MKNDDDVLERDAVDAAYQVHAAKDFLTFAKGLIIPSASGPQQFSRCMAGFQREFFEDISLSLTALRDGKNPLQRRFWLERTKKAGKDSDLAVCLLWLLAFSQKPLYLQVGAADKEQASIVKSRMKDLLYYNPWLKEQIKPPQTWRLLSLDDLVVLDILAADVAGSHGATPDLLVVNELSHVTRWEFVQNLLDNADGVPQGIVVIATNAGWKGTKAHALRRAAAASPNWAVYVWHEPAPWLSESDVADAERRNTKSRFDRLWRGRWVSGKGDALTEDDIDRCFRPGIEELEGREPGWRYVAGLDLGVSHDHAGMVVIGVNEADQVLKVVRYRDWAPRRAAEIDLTLVEEACRAAWNDFGVCWFGYDPHQAKLMAQRLTKEGVPMREMTFSSPKNLTAMAQSLVQVVEAGRLICYDDGTGTLRRDFGKFDIVERAGGLRLEATSDEFGHADVGTALVICLPEALQMLGGLRRRLESDDELFFDDAPLSDEEIDEMPPELRDIYDSGDDRVLEKEREFV